MFNLEQSIADWRRQMLAVGIETPVPLDELEIHLREEIERQVKLGLNEQIAFEVSARRIGRPEILGNEFKNSDGTLIKKIGIFAAIVGAVIISRILTGHPDAEHLRKNEQTAWLIAGSIIVLFGTGIALIKVGSDRGGGQAVETDWRRLFDVCVGVFNFPDHSLSRRTQNPFGIHNHRLDIGLCRECSQYLFNCRLAPGLQTFTSC
jgi:hypothetical protein